MRPPHGHQGGQVRQVCGLLRLPGVPGPKRLVKDTGGICPQCGKGRMLERKSAKGRIYYGCERYPDCDFMTWDARAQTCPHCGKTLFKRRGQLYCAKEGCGFVKNIEKTNAEK